MSSLLLFLLVLDLGEAHLVAVHDILDISGGHTHRPQGVLKVRIDGKEEQRLDEEGQFGEHNKQLPNGTA